MLFKNLSYNLNNKEVGIIHFSGIGGIGMSGIAKIIHSLGFRVQGSDIKNSNMIQTLRDIGIPVTIPQSTSSIGHASVVIRSSAIKDQNPEIVAARKLRIPILKRAEMLGEIMRMYTSIAIGGMHGKTTTTSLIGHILTVANLDPTVVTGGIINNYKNNIRLGKNNIIVVEADESDGSLVLLPALWAVITNIDYDHLDYYKNFAHILDTFKQFVRQIPFYGNVFICLDDHNNRRLIAEIPDRQFISYGFSPQAQIQAINNSTSSHGQTFDVVVQKPLRYSTSSQSKIILSNIHIPLYGTYNILNSLAAISVAYYLDIPIETIKQALQSFHGVKRRFSNIPIQCKNPSITIIDDYAHHPVEIQAVLNAASSLNSKRIIAIFQPHRYSRLNNLFEGFAQAFHKANMVIILPTYTAGESYDPKQKNYKDLVEAIQNFGHHNVIGFEDMSQFFSYLNTTIQPHDMLLFMGAGDITDLAHGFAKYYANTHHDTPS